MAGQQDGLEHGQAPQTTLIYRTAFQSLFQCAFHLHKYKHGGGGGGGGSTCELRKPGLCGGRGGLEGRVEIIDRDKTNKQE